MPAPVIAIVMPVVAAAVVAVVIHRAVDRIRVVVDRCRAVVIRGRVVRGRRVVIAGVIRRIIRAAVIAVDAVVVADAVARAIEAQADADVAACERGRCRDEAGQQQARCDQTATKGSGFHVCLRSVDASIASSRQSDESVLSAGHLFASFFVQLRTFNTQHPCMFGRLAKSGGILARVSSSITKRSLSESSNLNRRALLENTIAPPGSSRSAHSASNAAWSRWISKSCARLELENVGGST